MTTLSRFAHIQKLLLLVFQGERFKTLLKVVHLLQLDVQHKEFSHFDFLLPPYADILCKRIWNNQNIIVAIQRLLIPIHLGNKMSYQKCLEYT